MDNTQTSSVSPEQSADAPILTREELAQTLANPPRTPKEANDQLTQLLRRLVSDTGRHENQIQYLGRRLQDNDQQDQEHLQYIEACLRVLFEHLHLEMPQRRPPILDAKVELIAPSEKDEAEQLEMRAAYNTKPHPVRGHYEILLGEQSVALDDLHPKVVVRLVEAFGKLLEAGTLEESEFYFVRLHTVHSRPIDERAVQVRADTLEPVDQ